MDKVVTYQKDMGDFMDTCKISVILSTYNRQKLLPRMLDSLLNQKFKEFEVILINNGSTDDSQSICEKYEKEDARIRLYRIEKNNGPSFARNLGINKAKSDYICFVDDDDYCEPNYLSILYNLITEYDADIAISGSVYEYSDQTISPKYIFDETYVYNKVDGVSEFLKRDKYNTSPATKLFKKELFENVRFIAGVKIDDIHVIYKLFVNANKVVVNGVPTYRFYKHSGNMTGFIQKDILTPEILDDYLNMQKERVEYISKKIPILENQVRYAAFSYMISMIEKINNGHSINCELQYDIMVQRLRKNKDEFLNCKWITEREINLMTKYVL